MTAHANSDPARTAGKRAESLAFRIVPARFPDVPSAARDTIAALAAACREENLRIGDTAPFGPAVHPGMGPGPAIHFGDVAEIPLIGSSSEKRLDYRLGWLAGPGDLVVIGGADCPHFEAYQRHWLAAPGIRYLNVDPQTAVPRRATPVICLRDPASFQRLCAGLQGHANVTLQAHVTTGTIWALAARLSREAGKTVHVNGPPPQLSRLANDKLWFGALVARLFGAGAVPPKRAAQSASALTRQVADLARKWDRLVIKVPDSAGSVGNLVLASEDIRALGAAALYRHLNGALAGLGRPPRFPMLVEVWDTNVLQSPSVQTWIPRPEHGPPVIEGLFEQVLAGPNAEFTGAVPADLPERVDAELCQGAMQIALLFQQLGYFGRCSFDAIVSGTEIAGAAIHWIECNARWGGVSIPMSLVNRLAAPGSTAHYAIVQDGAMAFRPLGFAELLGRFADLQPDADLRSGALFLSPGLMEAGAGCHFVSFGSSGTAAMDQAQKIRARFARV